MAEDIEGVLGYFATPEELEAAVRRAQAEQVADLEVYLPVEDEAIVEAVMPPPSPARWFAAAGAVFGFAGALAMTVWMSWNYPLPTGGKPIVSLPPYLVIAVAMLILFAALGGVAGFLWCARLPRLTPTSAYRREMAVDRFALLLRSVPTPAERARADRVLRAAGATEVQLVYCEDRGILGDVP